MWWWLYIAAYLLLFFMVLLLPTGRLRSRRWRWAGWLGVCCIALIVPSLFARRPLHPKLPAITNPVGLLPPSPVLDLLDHVAEDVLLSRQTGPVGELLTELAGGRWDLGGVRASAGGDQGARSARALCHCASRVRCRQDGSGTGPAGSWRG